MKKPMTEWEVLVPLLYKEYWYEDEAMWLFAGFKADRQRERYTDLKTGVVYETTYNIPKAIASAKAAFQMHWEMWTGSSHPTQSGLWRPAGGGYSQYNKYYFLHWASKIPVITIDWLEWAKEAGHLNTDDQRRMEDLLNGNVVKIKPEATPDEESKGYENLLRLTGVLREMLADPKVIEQLAKDPETFKKTGELANYIGHEYGSQECFNNKGLSKKSCNDRFAEAKKILNNDRL